MPKDTENLSCRPRYSSMGLELAQTAQATSSRSRCTQRPQTRPRADLTLTQARTGKRGLKAFSLHQKVSVLRNLYTRLQQKSPMPGAFRHQPALSTESPLGSRLGRLLYDPSRQHRNTPKDPFRPRQTVKNTANAMLRCQWDADALC